MTDDNSTPIWTAFITHSVMSKRWCRRGGERIVCLGELRRHIFSSEYQPQIAPSGEHILRFDERDGRGHFECEKTTHLLMWKQTRMLLWRQSMTLAVCMNDINDFYERLLRICSRARSCSRVCRRTAPAFYWTRELLMLPWVPVHGSFAF